MNTIRMRAVAGAAVVVALMTSMAACSSTSPTAIIVYTTATPAPTATMTPLPTPPVTPTPEPTPDLSGSPTPAPTATATVGSASPGPTGPADACNGFSAAKTVENRKFFSDAAHTLSFAVYCGRVGTGWFFATGTWTQPSGGYLTATYKTSKGAQVVIQEGNFSSASCVSGSNLGSANFGDLSGTMYSTGATSFTLCVAPGTAKAYTATGTGITQAAFTAVSAALVKVRKT